MSETTRMRLPKHERLCSEKAIKPLFNKGAMLFQHPFKVYYMPLEEGTGNREGTPQILVMAPKRNFKNAVVRNLLKRRMREAYRLNKHLYPLPSIALGFLYIGKSVEEFAGIEAGMKKALKKLSQTLQA
jgi:ribonuclease P protein component